MERTTAARATSEQIDALGPWFHNLHLPDGAQTAPDHRFGDFPAFKWRATAPHIPDDLAGATALDIGCNAGFYTFELARRGARVTAIDVDEHYLTQARWAASVYGLEQQVSFRKMQVYDLAQEQQQYDIVLFMGVFYHLRYPMLGMDIVCERVRGTLVFQTLMLPGDGVVDDTYVDRDISERAALADPDWPRMSFVEHRFCGDPTNWWVPNRGGVEAMLRSSGMQITARPDAEIFVCERDPSRPTCVSTWNRPELLSATGRPWDQGSGV